MSTEIDFPPAETADEDGVVMWSSELSPQLLLAGYRRGIFVWPCDDDDTAPVPWCSPDPRGVIELDQFRISRRLRQTIAGSKFRITVNADFAGVLEGCAARREQDGPSWLTPRLRSALLEMHAAGDAHSVEVWHEGRLAGGVYGVAIGGYFSAESMFFRVRDASKVALAALVQRLRERDFALLDIQVTTPHTRSLGATEIARTDFLKRLAHALELPRQFAGSLQPAALGDAPPPCKATAASAACTPPHGVLKNQELRQFHLPSRTVRPSWESLMTPVHEVHQGLVESELMSVDEADRQLAAWREASGEKSDDAGVAFVDWLVAQSELTELQGDALKAGHRGPFMLGPYRVQQRLAAGTLGNVYRAVHVELNQPVSLKVFPSTLKDNEEQLARMQREARASVELDHPNIVRTFQIGRAGDIYYLAFQDLQGETLLSKLTRDGAMEPAEAARLMCDAARALGHLHEKGFVHRDVRPANMWITTGGVLKLMEFGGVSAAIEGMEEDGLTTSDTVIGSIDYMAPEQAADPHAADHRSDIYSLGCTLYHCLAGEKPFREKNPIRLAMKHAMELPPALKDWIPGVPEKLSNAVDSMIAKSPADRFQSAQDVVWAMEENFDTTQERSNEEVASQEFLKWAGSPQNPEHERVHEARSPELAGFMHWLAGKHPEK